MDQLFVDVQAKSQLELQQKLEEIKDQQKKMDYDGKYKASFCELHMCMFVNENILAVS